MDKFIVRIVIEHELSGQETDEIEVELQRETDDLLVVIADLSAEVEDAIRKLDR